jgi:sec-independent protein translocase protein TatB
MFDLDVSKMIIVGIVALAVIPPKDLPRVMRTVGQALGRMRRMAAEFQGQPCARSSARPISTA